MVKGEKNVISSVSEKSRETKRFTPFGRELLAIIFQRYSIFLKNGISNFLKFNRLRVSLRATTHNRNDKKAKKHSLNKIFFHFLKNTPKGGYFCNFYHCNFAA